ncbi:IS701 family transposase [Myxococcus qinghaiensis]|uniref:IS701 family transposase n=1 Tax=Myxococcus qinghaiensis TaxID=2906758 RepID=UPI0020A73FA0|nr:IS701 family transposase [Myxococcus qinghaiensis]MCP3167929.1 IS701 family transposase [Myxococcus qinghaiensis]
MTPKQLKRLEGELASFLESMFSGLGRVERRRAMDWYVKGLLLEGERKSIDPMAGRLVEEAGEKEAMRQRLQQCVSGSAWADEEVRRRLALKLEADLPGIEALVLDDTGFPKKGKHSVGVARQYSGTLGRTDNCQVAVSLHLAGEKGSGCLGMQLYLPAEWTSDTPRMRKAGVPEDVAFKTKHDIALELIGRALDWGVKPRLFLADCGYGNDVKFREELTRRGLPYIVGIRGDSVVWPPGFQPPPIPPKPAGMSGPVRSRYRYGESKPVAVEKLAAGLPKAFWKHVNWREGAKGMQCSRFAALRIRIAHGHSVGLAPGDEQWLISEWLSHEKSPTKFHLSTLPAATPLKQLVRLTKLRWRVERDYQELRGEVGLDHFEGRTWRGFHHHATLCAVAHGFLALRRALFPPEPSALDAANGEARDSASAAPADWHLPALQQGHQPQSAA